MRSLGPLAGAYSVVAITAAVLHYSGLSPMQVDAIDTFSYVVYAIAALWVSHATLRDLKGALVLREPPLTALRAVDLVVSGFAFLALFLETCSHLHSFSAMGSLERLLVIGLSVLMVVHMLLAALGLGALTFHAACAVHRRRVVEAAGVSSSAYRRANLYSRHAGLIRD